MRKHTLHGIWHRFSGISVLVLTIGFIAMTALSIFALRQNNIKMVELKAAVYKADESGGDTETALKNLRDFVFTHMNTTLRSGSNSSEPPIQLVNRFNAAVAAEQARVAALNNAAQVYAAAQASCERSSLPLTARAQCIQDYVSRNGKGIPAPNLPAKEFYTFDFASPRWSPDLAGWALVASALLGILLIIRIASGIVLKFYLK